MINNKRYFDFLLLVVISFIFFFRSLNIYFLSENIEHIESAQFLLTNFQYGNYFRPVWALTLIIDKFLWGPNYSGYHLSNLAFHTLNAILIYILAFQILQDRFFSIASSFLFLIHPIHSLSIFWISGRTDSVCSIFYLSSLIFFISFSRSGKIRYQIFSVMAFLFALFSKEMAVSLPIIILAFEIIFGGEVLKTKLSHAIRRCSSHFVVLIFFFIFKMFFVGEGTFENAFHSNLNLLQLAKNLASYLGLLIVPGGHIAIANFLRANPIWFGVLSVSLSIVLIISFNWIRKSKLAIFFVLFVVVTLIPVIRLMMRWYLYIPSIGFCLGIGYGLYRLYQYERGKRLSVISFIFICLIYSGFLQLELQRWIKAGELSKKISYQIAKVISERDEDNYLFLDVPAELKEVPVMIFGLESVINFRLRNDFNSHQHVEINSLSYISLSELKDLDQLRIRKLQNGVYGLELAGTQSDFIFPHSAEVVSKRRRLKEGDILNSGSCSTRIMGMNDKKEINRITVEVDDKSIPVIYYKEGNILVM